MSENILERVKEMVGSLLQARYELHEVPYATMREELFPEFESLKKRADLIADPQARAIAYKALAALERLLTDPPAYSLTVQRGRV